MIPVTNAYETGYLVKDHMREGLREVERDRLGRTMIRKVRQRFLYGIFARMKGNDGLDAHWGRGVVPH